MNLHDRVFERALIRRAIAESYKIAGGWPAYRRARRKGPKRIGTGWTVVMTLIVSVMLVAAGSTIRTGWPVLSAATAIGSTGVAFLFGAAFRHSMNRPLSIVTMGHLPIPDRTFARIEIDRSVKAAGVVFLLVGIFHASMAVSLGKAFAGIPLGVFFAAVQWAFALSAGMLLGVHFVPRVLVWPGLVLFLLSFVVPLVPNLNRAVAALLEDAPWALLCLPAGIVEYGFGSWLREGNTTALFVGLSPLATLALVPSTFRLLNEKFRTDSSEFNARFEAFRGALRIEVIGPGMPPPSTGRNPASVVNEELRGDGSSWIRPGFVERLVARCWGGRDRAVAALMNGFGPTWSGSWLAGLVTTAFGLFLTALPFRALDIMGLTIVLAGNTIAAPLFGGRWMGLTGSGAGGITTPVCAYFPVTFGEAGRVVIFSNLIRWAIWSPFMIASAALAWDFIGGRPATAALFGVKVAYGVVALEPLCFVFKLDPGTSGMRLFGSIRHIAVWTLILLLTLGSAFCLVEGIPLPARAEIWLLPLLSCAVFAVFGVLYNKGKVDLVRPSWLI